MSINKVYLLGNLTRDAEIRSVGDSQVASFGLATSERYTDRSGERREQTEFHNVELWGNNGVHQYLKKGTQVFIEGSIRTEKWNDQNGQQRQVTKIRASQIQLVGSRPQQTQQAAPQQQPQYQQPIPPQGYPGAPAPGYHQNYGPVVQPPQPPMPQQPPMPPQPQYPPQGASTTQPQQPTVFSQPGAEYDPSNYPDDLPADFGPMR